MGETWVDYVKCWMRDVLDRAVGVLRELLLVLIRWFVVLYLLALGSHVFGVRVVMRVCMCIGFVCMVVRCYVLL